MSTDQTPRPRKVDHLPAREMTDKELAREALRLARLWADCMADTDGHSGSPGEWIWERRIEIAAEEERRGAP